MSITKTGGIKPMKQDTFKSYLWFDGIKIVGDHGPHGKRFAIHAIRHSRDAAEEVASSLIKRGYHARVVSYAKGVKIWGVYARREQESE